MIETKNNYYSVDGKPLFVYSGEMHYFRIKPSLWDKHLKAAKEAGLNTVSSYIPWSWHESNEGEFDFEGKTHPQKNLVGFIKRAKKHNLKIFLRVGPVSNAEMTNEGIPGWLLKNYPEVFIQGQQILNLPHVTILNYLNDTFLSYVKNWYEQVLGVISKYQWPQGNVSFIQLENEIGMIQWLNKAADYSQKAEKMYQDFLKQRYNNIEALNSRYLTNYNAFSEIKQPKTGHDSQPMGMLLDWMNFYQEYYALYYKQLYGIYESKHINLPVSANIPQYYDYDVRGRGVFSPMTTMMFKNFPKYVPNVVFGGAYQMRRLDYENFHDIAITTEVVKMITTPDVPSICAELQTGIMRDRPRLYSQDVALNLRTSTAHGLNGLNCYMFSGGKSEPEFGAFGTFHEWQSPVSSDGKKRPHYKPVKDFGSIVKTFGAQLAMTKKHYDTVIGFYPPYYTTEYLTGPKIERWEFDKHQLFYDGIARLLLLAHLNYKFLDIEKASIEELLEQKSIWVFTLEFMAKDVQEKLVEYVKRGGKLVLNPYIPQLDLALNKCTILSDYLGIIQASKSGKKLFYNGKEDFLAMEVLLNFDVSGDFEIISKTIEGKPCAMRINKDKGSALILGMGLNHMFDYHVELVKKLAGMADVRPSINLDNDLQATLRKTDNYGFLFLANYHDEAKSTKIKMVLPGEKTITEFPKKGSISMFNRSGYILPLNVVLPSGDRIRYSTCEILKINESKKGKTIIVSASAGSDVEIELVAKCKNAYTEGKKLSCSKRKGVLRINFQASGGIQEVIVKA